MCQFLDILFHFSKCIDSTLRISKMCIPPLKNCFYIFPLSFGVVCISIIEMFISFMSIISIVLYEDFEASDNETKNNQGNFLMMSLQTRTLFKCFQTAKWTFIAKLISDAIMTFASILLLCGAIRRKLGWLIPFLVFDLIHIVLIGLYIFEKATTNPSLDVIMSQVVFFGEFHVMAITQKNQINCGF